MNSSDSPVDDSPASSTGSVKRYAGALHEVSNALTVVLGWLERANSATSLDDVKAAVAVAREHARRGRWLARESIGAQVDRAPDSRSAADLVRFVVQSVSPQADERSVTLEMDIGSGTEVRVEGENAISQILMNLLLNAIAFTPENSRVRASVSRSAHGVTFTVEDEGPGVPPEVVEDLFSAPVSTRRGGAGIGLPFSRSLALEHGGELELVDPLESGHTGARFELTWPSARSDQVGLSAVPFPSELLRGTRILVIEDDLAISSLIDLSLEAYGAQAQSLATFAEVSQGLAQGLTFDAALVDLSPIKKNLKEILTQLKDQGGRAPIVLMSGEPTGVPEGAEGRFSSWVRKPFDMDQLLRTLAQLLRDQ